MFSTRLSLVAIYVLRFASPVHSLHAKRSIDDAELIARAFEINADAVFPHEVDKRGLLGGILSVAGNGVNTILDNVGGGLNTLLGGATAATSTVAAVVNPTTTAANNGGGNTVAPATSTAGSGNAGDSNANNGSGTTSANNNGNNNNGNTNGNGANTTPSNGGGAASASGSGNSANGGTAPMNALYTGSGAVTAVTIGVLTDHSGHTITTTGTAPITLTYVTTLPNGVVSTVTEVITPTAEVFGEPITTGTFSSASRVAAIAGSIVAVFIVVFIIAFVLLMLRKRKRRSQMANSRPESSLSFGSSDILNHNHRDSSEPLEPTGSMTSFRTAPAYVDGQKMEFPLPPVPSADLNHSEMTGTSQRPISMGSDLTSDLMERRSRTSLIAERNFYRKVGQYPEAGSYTPFALAPSSELGHSEEAFGHNNAYESTSDPKEFHENYRRSRNLDFAPSVHENPFNDPAYIAQPAAPAPVASNQRQSGLWRKATFGSSQQPSKRLETHPPSSFAQPHVDTFGRKSSTASADRGTVVSHASSDYETATETQSKHSSGGYSYHSAFARYANDPNVENPFADVNGSPPPSSRLLTSAAGWRPATAGSTASLSVMSSTGNSARELGSTPDPKDLFYHPPSTGQSSIRPATATSQPARPWSVDSTRVSEDDRTEETVRQKNIAYPSLQGVVQQMQAKR